MRDLSADAWERATHDERKAGAERLVGGLPSGFRFVDLWDASPGSRAPLVARFTCAGRTFALVPGGSFAVGLSVDGWRPNADELESFTEAAEEYGIEHTITEYLAQATRPRRVVDVRPMLVETLAEEVGWIPVNHDEPEAREALEQLPAGGPWETKIFRGGSQLSVVRSADGVVAVRRAMPDASHASLLQRVAGEGYRFPTADEWEYLCGVGTGTLFRWGDHVPCDRYPIDGSPEEQEWRRQWALSGGTLERPPGGFRRDWDLHLRPNALGLHIAANPYKSELVHEPDITRGGDGGASICGGVGFFMGWIPLATSYFEEHSCRRDPAEPVQVGYAVARRVLALA